MLDIGLSVFQGAGTRLPRPSLYFISGPTQTPCGKISGSYYCGYFDLSETNIYLHSDLITDTNQWWRLRAFDTIAHEYGHHVQMAGGLFRASTAISDAGTMTVAERQRRLELQASCWAARIAVATPVTQYSPRDHAIFIQWSQRDQDEYHGSAASNQYWWQRGQYMSKVGGCNTWTVGSSRVS
ncbi:neutral zinc metallopeptidase [Aestuariimicrobium sp. Y1814]|uniref:neutral zinc metallopeptidase n=1 Tax=Aestuariimicrobium sp. Y1814 TaxID=3418742 RepID=UPI003DA7A0EB